MLLSRIAVMLTAASWLRTRRSRFVFFLLCSPLLLPILCASIPLICAAEIFFRLRRRRSRIGKSISVAVASADEDDMRLRRCEEGCGCDGFGGGEEEGEEETGLLLQRYLEDQLLLVRSVYDCGEDAADADDGRDRDPDRNRVPLLS
ncbi:PREDICTED: uncharacterized protein LOC104806792 [Tarenaya hassleriana]|uniref:uncharacterized protein LOC104806792 n=1 Tax=Tarenaya hassleriana TaxID=28532 RepID=UPI00053C9C16|nr:PREDICTED: uncharacterized protein LOC104806792 [Tarenaya hassleriana]